MPRLLLIVAIAAVAWYLYRQWTLTGAGQGGAPGQAPPPPPQTAMTRCLECGVHVPETAGVRYQNLFFCCPDHMNSYLRKQGQS